MFELIRKQRILLVLVVAFLLIITGCSSNSDSDEDLNSKQGKLNL
jgi:PBP1b-binding outer membrane lipoprotein LpoB